MGRGLPTGASRIYTVRVSMFLAIIVFLLLRFSFLIELNSILTREEIMFGVGEHTSFHVDLYPDAFLENLATVDKLNPSARVLFESLLTRTNKTDDEIDPVVEQKRCARYGFHFQPEKRNTRRKIFFGSLIADDSWHVIAIAAHEYFGLFDTVAFVESNTTQSMLPRSLRFENGSLRKRLLSSSLLWGATVRTHVDYFDDLPDSTLRNKALLRENMQRNKILERWKENGMTDNDIGFLADVDEVATKDFLRALQICSDIPQFEEHAQCREAKISTVMLSMEGSPRCIQIPRRVLHPDVILGECIHQIGDPHKHPPVPRVSKHSVDMRIPNWTTWRPPGSTDPDIGGPLWDATDFRMEKKGRTEVVGSTPNLPHLLHTGYHFHNFFDSLEILRRKYKTYGHPKPDAMKLPLSAIQKNDLGFMADCLSGRRISGTKWRLARGNPKKSTGTIAVGLGGAPLNSEEATYGVPVAFQMTPSYANLRHAELQEELRLDETTYGYAQNVTSKD